MTGVRVCSLMSVMLIIGAGCSDGSGASTSPPNAATEEAAESLAPTTASPTTAVPTTLPPTTAAPTTTLAAPTVDALFYLMPGPLDLPTGWSSLGGMPDGSLVPAEGDAFGLCGGPNGDMRAQTAGVLASMNSPTYKTEPGGWAQFGIYAFPSADDAQKLIDATMTQAQCPNRPSYQAVEGAGPGQYDGFGDSYGEGKAVWEFQVTLSVGGADVPGDAKAFSIIEDFTISTQYKGRRYAKKTSLVYIYEQHDRLVFVSSLTGDCCNEGFSNSASQVNYTATVTDLASGMTVIRPIVIQRLVDAKLL